MTKLCIIAGNYKEAEVFARGQNLSNDQWFYPIDEDDLKRRTNFHVLVIGTAGQNVPPSYFDKLYHLAQAQGRIGR